MVVPNVAVVLMAVVLVLVLVLVLFVLELAPAVAGNAAEECDWCRQCDMASRVPGLDGASASPVKGWEGGDRKGKGLASVCLSLVFPECARWTWVWMWV